MKAPAAADGERRRCPHDGIEDAPDVLQEQVEEALPLLFGHLVHKLLSVDSLVGQLVAPSKAGSIHQAKHVQVKEERGYTLAILDASAPSFAVDTSSKEIPRRNVITACKRLLDIAAALWGCRPDRPDTDVRVLRVHLLRPLA